MTTYEHRYCIAPDNEWSDWTAAEVTEAVAWLLAAGTKAEPLTIKISNDFAATEFRIAQEKGN